ncbi:hypothetical protein GGR92_003735 [Spirosoma lacussanchae]
MSNYDQVTLSCSHDSAFKVKVVLEALKGTKSLAQLAI